MSVASPTITVRSPERSRSSALARAGSCSSTSTLIPGSPESRRAISRPMPPAPMITTDRFHSTFSPASRSN